MRTRRSLIFVLAGLVAVVAIGLTVGGWYFFVREDDTDRIASPPPHSPTRGVYGGCGREVQGISAGWGDTYSSSTPGQELDIRGVPDGRYAIRSTADPENRLLETNDTNNRSIVYIQLTGNRIERLPRP